MDQDLSSTPPPPFQWDEWYKTVGGRSIKIDEVDVLLKQIHQEQYPRFGGEVAPEATHFASPREAALHLFAKHYYCSICLPVCVYNYKEWARDFEGFQTKLFPQVLMGPPPPPVDLPVEKRHSHYRPETD